MEAKKVFVQMSSDVTNLLD